MLSNHDFVTAVCQRLYPMSRAIEQECLDLHSKQLPPGRGPTGVTGTNELHFTIGYLESAVALLKRVGKEQGEL